MCFAQVHGGVAEKDIVAQVKRAKELAEHNRRTFGNDVSTILFFDEANTTDAISLIKEIMVDRRMHGKSLQPALCGLEIIAACNPYRRYEDVFEGLSLLKCTEGSISSHFLPCKNPKILSHS